MAAAVREAVHLSPPKLKQDFFALLQKPSIRQILPNKTRFEYSSNWCGASIVPNGGQQFVLMFGEWTVPTPELPPPSEQGPSVRRTLIIASHGSGSTGNRRYLDSTLPQIGTNRSSPSMPTVRRPASIPPGFSGGRAIRSSSQKRRSPTSRSMRGVRSWPWSGSSIRIMS